MRAATSIFVAIVMVLVVIPAQMADASSVVPPGADQPQPTPQCPAPIAQRTWFQANCPYSWTFADPSIIVVPDDPNVGGGTGYYAFATNTGGASLPVMWSTDPIDGPWVPRPAYTNNFNDDHYFNDALSAPYSGGTQPPPWVITEAANGMGWETKHLQAPGALRINANKYVVFFAGQDSPGHWCIGRAIATNPWGPYTATTQPAICGAPDGSPNGVLDPQPFTAPNGQQYLIYKSEGVPGSKPTSIYVRKLDANGNLSGSTITKLLSTDATWQMSNPSTSTGVIENPAMVYFGGRYYLFYSGNEWRTDNYGTGYATCAGPTGPCTDQSKSGPLLRSGAGYTGAGGATPFVTPDHRLIVGFAAWNVPGSHNGGTRVFRTRELFPLSNGHISLTDPVANRNYVAAAYQDFLDRSAGSSELSYWANRLSDGTSTRKQFMSTLTTSSEWIGATVNKLYVDTLGRQADTAGLNYWVHKISSGNTTVAQAAANFYSSGEYFRGFGESNTTTWIRDLYTKLLGRSADASGLHYWQTMTSKRGRYWVAYAFYQSSESRHARVNALYHQLLGRGPDGDGWDYWATQIKTLGDLALAANLGVSSEYYRRAQP